MSNIEAFVDYVPWNDQLRLIVRFKEHDGRRYYLKSPELVEVPISAHISAVPIMFDGDASPQIEAKEFIQAVMDAGWKWGIRPTGFTDVENETKAIRYHLEDMRKLTFLAFDKLTSPIVKV